MKKITYLILILLVVLFTLPILSACEKKWEDKYIVIETDGNLKVQYKNLNYYDYFYDIKLDDKRICYVFGDDCDSNGFLVSRENNKDFKGFAKFSIGVPECTTENMVVKVNGNIVEAESVAFTNKYVFADDYYYMPIYTYSINGAFKENPTISVSGLNPESKRDVVLYFSNNNESKYYAVYDGSDFIKISSENQNVLTTLGYDFTFVENIDYTASLTYKLYTNMQEIYLVSKGYSSPRAYIQNNGSHDNYFQRIAAYSENVVPQFGQILYEEQEMPNDIYSFRIFGENIYSLYFC